MGPETKTFKKYYSKFLYSHLFGMSLSLPWQSIAWSCSGNLQEVAINIIRPHTNPLGILEIKRVAITTLENIKSPPNIKHIKVEISSFLIIIDYDLSNTYSLKIPSLFSK